jgi:tight adherence protein C
MIRAALILVCLMVAEEARSAWRRDRAINGHSARSDAHWLGVLIAIGRITGAAGSRLPAPPLQRERLIERSGHAATLDERGLREARAGSVTAFGGVAIVALVLLSSPVGLVLAAGCVLFGWLYPDLWLRAAASRRAERIERDAPLAIDLIASAVAAGISIDDAIRAAAEAASGPLRAELDAVSANLMLGSRRNAELRDLGERTASPSLARLAAALRISDRLGVPLAAGLRRQASRSRIEQARRVQERAAKAAPRILLVVVFVLVPAAMLPVMTALGLVAVGSVGSFLG